MAVGVDELVRTGMMREQARTGLRADVFSDLSAVETLWRGIEADPDALATPYQRFDWVRAFLAGECGGDGARQAGILRVVVLRDAAGPVRLLLPLVLARERGALVARVVGRTHANYHMPLFASREAAGLHGADIAAALRAVGREAGIDVYMLCNQPLFWDGAVNPLAARGEPAPSDAYGLQLGPDPESTVRRVFSAEARKKLRAKEKKLVEAHGPVALRVAATAAEANAFLATFYRQKATRFAALGIVDPYADPSVRRFLDAATDRSTAPGGHPAIEVSALVGCDDGRIHATFAGAVDARRFSGMMTAFDQDPAMARFSPGDILLHHLVRHQAAAGRRAFDLGVGEARYKASICDETIQLREVSIPVTVRGRLFTAAVIARVRIRRRIKRDPRLLAVAMRLRRGWRARFADPSA